MHMGCMKFKQRGREEQAEADGTEVITPLLNYAMWNRITCLLVLTSDISETIAVELVTINTSFIITFMCNIIPWQ